MLRGPDSQPSIIGVERCDALDFVFLFILLVLSIGLTFVGVRIVSFEHQQKIECGYELTKGDLDFTMPQIMNLVGVSVVCAFLVAVVGVTPGSVFVPLLITLGYNVAVASSTGIFLVMITAGSATINAIVFHLLDLRYSLLINILTIIGTIQGVYGQEKIVKLTGGRYQFTILG